MRKIIFTILYLSLIVFNLQADEVKEEKIFQLLHVTEVVEEFNNNLKSPLNKGFIPKLNNDEIHNEFIKEFDRAFTEKEIDYLLSFFRTPYAQKWLYSDMDESVLLPEEVIYVHEFSASQTGQKLEKLYPAILEKILKKVR